MFQFDLNLARAATVIQQTLSCNRSVGALLCAGTLAAWGVLNPLPIHSAQLQLGANVNEHLTALTPDLLARSHTTWVRGFVPASEFITGTRNLETDLGLNTLREAGKSGRKVILTIKWDLKMAGWRVPEPGTALESRWFLWAEQLLDSMQSHISILVLVNELYIDTPAEDLQPEKDGRIPMVDFLRRLAAHLQEQQRKQAGSTPIPLYCGGFTRLDMVGMQKRAATRSALNWLSQDTNIAGVTFHMHQREQSQFEQALQFIRRQIQSKPLMVTEFSPIWKYRAHLEDRIDREPAGAAFARRYGIKSDLTVREYINTCLKQPVPEAQWQDFLRSQSWFDLDFLGKTCDLMESHGVSIATYAFSQLGSGGRRTLREDSTPWLLNPIFVPFVARSAYPKRSAVTLDFFDEYVRRQRDSAVQTRASKHLSNAAAVAAVEEVIQNSGGRTPGNHTLNPTHP